MQGRALMGGNMTHDNARAALNNSVMYQQNDSIGSINI